MTNLVVPVLAAVVWAAAPPPAVSGPPSQRPETVILTLQPRSGAEDEVAKALADHWSTARKSDLVKPDLHVTLRGRDDQGQPYFVEIFTWRDIDIPDHPPAAIAAIWDRLNALTETRAGRPGIDIKAVVLVAP